MRQDQIQNTAITTPFGLFEFIRMPFGLKNSAQAFQRLMDGVLQDIPFLFVYLDDILIASPSLAAHVSHVKLLFERLSAAGLAINITVPEPRPDLRPILLEMKLEIKPIKAVQPEVLSIEADTDTKDKWLRQYETYYYQSKINETDKAMQLALVTACLDAKLTEACVGAGQVPTITKQGTGNSHFKVIVQQPPSPVHEAVQASNGPPKGRAKQGLGP